MEMRMTQVHEVIDLAPHMRRIVLMGEELSSFPTDMESAHVKVIVPRPGQEKPELAPHSGMKKYMRSYTIRHFDKNWHLLALDFVVSRHEGLCTNWAKNAKVGDFLGIAGPGPVKHKDFNADWHLLLGDITALPAIAATLERLPQTARGAIYIHVPSAEDKQELTLPDNMNLHWLINDDNSQNILLECLKNAEVLEGKPAVFIAAEGAHVQAMLGYLKSAPYYDKELTYTSGYWNAARKPRKS